MARLEPLIKVRKHLVDEKQRFLAGLYAELEGLKARKDALLHDIAREQALVAADDTNLEARAFFTHYKTRVMENIADIDVAMARMDTRILVAMDDIRAAFAELKKIEITHDARKKRDKKEVDDKDARAMDDIGISGFMRNREEE